MLTRLVGRIREDITIVLLAKNWRQVLRAKIAQQPMYDIRLRNGVSLRAPENVDLAFLFHEIWIRRIYAPAGHEIRAGDVVLDVGANVGVFSTFAATRAAQVRVFAYEPNPLCLPWLRQNVSSPANLGVTVHMEAMAGTPGSKRLRQHDNWLLSSLTDEASLDSDAVECVTLEEAFDRDAISRCDLLKLDCEGSEYEILFGAPASTLRKTRRIVAEYHPSPKGDLPSLCRFLEGHSFRVEDLVETRANEGYLCAARR